MKEVLALILSVCLFGCGGCRRRGEAPEDFAEPEIPLFPELSVQSPVPQNPDSEAYVLYREEAGRIVASLDDRLLAGQTLLAGIDNKTYLSPAMEAMFRDTPPGGIVLFQYNLSAGKDEIRAFLKECSVYAASVSGITPFIAVDHEGGLVHRFGPGVEKLPPAAFFWELAQEDREEALKFVEESAFLSGFEIRDMGITMNLAPVAEVIDEENRLFLETRSYGPDADFVREAASAFIRGMDAAGIACVLKHFPGNSNVDPHFELPVLQSDKAGLDLMVLPFAGIIKDLHPPALMVSHVLLPELDTMHIASLSPRLLRGWLREDLGFEGIIISDDFSMEAVVKEGINPPEAVVEALNAGADMVLVWPSNAQEVYDAILSALEENRLSRARLREAAERIVCEKLRYNLIEP